MMGAYTFTMKVCQQENNAQLILLTAEKDQVTLNNSWQFQSFIEFNLCPKTVKRVPNHLTSNVNGNPLPKQKHLRVFFLAQALSEMSGRPGNPPADLSEDSLVLGERIDKIHLILQFSLASLALTD